MELAKDAIDVGVMTNDWPAHRDALERLGVTYDHLLKVGGGRHQHRYDAAGSVLKVNSHRAPLDSASTTLSRVELVADTARPLDWPSPDGVAFRAVPPGHDGVETIRVTWSTPDIAATKAFLGEALGATTGDGDEWSIGRSRIVVREDTSVGPVGDLDAAGARYLTVQIRNVEREHSRIIEMGHDEGMTPTLLGSTARISFVRAPDGTWIELSQRASLTGDLSTDAT